MQLPYTESKAKHLSHIPDVFSHLKHSVTKSKKILYFLLASIWIFLRWAGSVLYLLPEIPSSLHQSDECSSLVAALVKLRFFL